MNRILRLPPLVAERIAAGEVIERPASVVKELVENSIDAGATQIRVSLESGGKNLIEVMDNGSGIHPSDLALATERHATSKIREVEDLEELVTLGFRGEALPSIQAMGTLSILTRTADAPSAVEYEPEVSKEIKPITFGHFLNSPHGTRIQVRNLFAQVPVRLKFLKSPSSEVSQIRDWMERLAMGHPQVGFELVTEGRTLFRYDPEAEEARVRSILSDALDVPVLSEQYESESGVKARLYWLQGLSQASTRKLLQTVNHRPLKDRVLQQAMLGPFRQTFLPGQFPTLALFLEIDPAEMDVNVHPTKSEVRFLEPSKIFRAVQRLGEQILGRHGAPVTVPAPKLEQTFQFSFDRAPAPHPTPTPPLFPPLRTSEIQWKSMFSPEGYIDTRAPLPERASDIPPPEPTTERKNPLEHATYVGLIFQTYVLYDLGEEAALIDQHAAHERIRFEALKLRQKQGNLNSQNLLMPEVVSVSSERSHLLTELSTLLETLGFDSEPFGENEMIVRSIPAAWASHDQGLKLRLANLADRALLILEEHPGAKIEDLLLDEGLFEKLASEACHSSVRAGDRISREEAEALTQKLFQCQNPWNCPHGRPTFVRIPRARFEEWFKRRI